MGDYKVYLGNIPDDTRERDVEKLFKGYGRIRDVVIKVIYVSENRMIIYRDLPLSAEREWNLRVLQVRGQERCG